MDTDGQAEMFRNRLVKRCRALRKWAARAGTDAYRVYDRDIPEIPLLLERWGGSASLSLYRRPYEKDAAEEARWLGAMARAAADALGIAEARVYTRLRERQRGDAQYGRLAGRGESETVRETAGGKPLAFRVNLSDYVDTGLFLDRRLLRARICAEAAGKRALNLFAYTCAFSVCAAAGGAARADSVDLSRTYLEWGKANFALNGLNAAAAGFIRADALAFPARAAASGLRWDLIVLDPPAFSNSKSMRGCFDLRLGHPALLRQCLALLAPGGALYFSAPAKRFALRMEPPAGYAAEDITERLRPPDFPSKPLPQCWRFTRED